MRVYDLIWKKREGEELSHSEIEFLISGLVLGKIPDYQISAWCMAVFFQGMTLDECAALTLAMADSGEKVDLASIPDIKVDKHSTGGVGDKTSLVVLPLVAACGVPVAKMSGRGLGHTGGTIDKLESIPGFQTSLSREKFLDQVKEKGIALIGQSGNLVPADKKLYALRDVTATIESVPLIASSIVSKKLAAGADAVVLDVKFGSGAFMKDPNRAGQLARTMVEIGKRCGKKFVAILSNMDQPLGRAIGNSLEVKEAIQTLKGEGPSDLTQLCVDLGGYMVFLGGKADSPETGRKLIRDAISSGRGIKKFQEFVKAQGGDPRVLEDHLLLPTAPVIEKVYSLEEGWLESVDCQELGLITMRLGAGRIKLEDPIYQEVGLIVYPKIGDYVKCGDLITEIHALSEKQAQQYISEVQQCFRLAQQSVSSRTLIQEVII